MINVQHSCSSLDPVVPWNLNQKQRTSDARRAKLCGILCLFGVQRWHVSFLTQNSPWCRGDETDDLALVPETSAHLWIKEGHLHLATVNASNTVSQGFLKTLHVTSGFGLKSPAFIWRIKAHEAITFYFCNREQRAVKEKTKQTV